MIQDLCLHCILPWQLQKNYQDAIAHHKILAYNVSQEYIEILFSKVQCHFGWNNNRCTGLEVCIEMNCHLELHRTFKNW